MRYALHEDGNAARLVLEHRSTARYVPEWKRWVRWDGRMWRIERGGWWRRECANRIQELLAAELDETEDEGERSAIVGWIGRSMSSSVMEQVGRLWSARCEADSTAWDRDPMVLQSSDGARVDLVTGESRPAEPSDMLLRKAGTSVGSGEPKRWTEFLRQVACGDDDLVGFLRRWFGYALTGDVGEQRLVVMHGDGANGKSVLLSVVQRVMGEYARRSSSQLVTVSRYAGGKPPGEVAALNGVRLAVVVELDDRAELDEGLIKSLTGGDDVNARFLYHDTHTFRPTAKLVLCSNHRPSVRGADHGIWRRVLAVPFRWRVPEADQDPHLAEKLAAEEGPAILGWMIRGALEWRQRGLDAPPCVLAETEDYRSQVGDVPTFLAECCRTGSDMKVPPSEMYEAYKAWCADRGNTPLTVQRFREGARSAGIETVRSNGKRWFRGIDLRPDYLTLLTERLATRPVMVEDPGIVARQWDTAARIGGLFAPPPPGAVPVTVPDESGRMMTP
ncbi:MAG: hypothetical protein GHCLOJNM_01593 [bacterium]|nr:hypothetical protein [bacterium]